MQSVRSSEATAQASAAREARRSEAARVEKPRPAPAPPPPEYEAPEPPKVILAVSTGHAPAQREDQSRAELSADVRAEQLDLVEHEVRVEAGTRAS